MCQKRQWCFVSLVRIIFDNLNFFTTLSGTNKKKHLLLLRAKASRVGVFPSPFTSSMSKLEVKGEGKTPLSKLLLEVRANAFFFSFLLFFFIPPSIL
jgi:hypothetical protein